MVLVVILVWWLFIVLVYLRVKYDNQNVENLFQNNLNCNLHESFESLDGVKVSAHFYIKRSGEIVQFVSVNDRAWHAGVSEFNGRQGCNDFSVGIEMQRYR